MAVRRLGPLRPDRACDPRYGDIELWVDRHDAHHMQRLLVHAGAPLLDTQPPEEPAEYNWDGTWFSTAYFDAQSDGTFTTNGRWDDWVFPVGSFPDEPVELEGLPLLAMSVAGMLAMKEQYPRRPGGSRTCSTGSTSGTSGTAGRSRRRPWGSWLNAGT
jgi:hypothetical protein